MTVKINISQHVKDNGLGEIYQSMENKMALLRPAEDASFTRITPYVLCRDFIVDVYTYAKFGKEFEVYGMTLDPTKEMPVMDRVYLAMTFPNPASRNNFFENLDHLHAIELANDFEPTSTQDAENGIVLCGDGKWLGSCLLWSLYTSLLRIFCYELKGDKPWFELMREKKGKTDADLLGSVDPETFIRVVSDLSCLVTPTWCGFDPAEEPVYTIHHNSGFYSVFGSHRELDEEAVRRNKHWQLYKEAGWTLRTK